MPESGGEHCSQIGLSPRIPSLRPAKGFSIDGSWLAANESAPETLDSHPTPTWRSGLPGDGRFTRMCSPWHLGELGVLDPRCRFRRREVAEWRGIQATVHHNYCHFARRLSFWLSGCRLATSAATPSTENSQLLRLNLVPPLKCQPALNGYDSGDHVVMPRGGD
jgi:hypothetical protein